MHPARVTPLIGIPVGGAFPGGPYPPPTGWGSHWSDCCSPDCGFCCSHFCCAPCKMGELVASLPPGSALCAGSCCGGGLLYGSLGLIVYGGALVTSGFFGLGLGLLGATGITTGCYHAHIRRAFRKQHGLEQQPCHDCPTAVFCDLCALCQETRELERRRFFAAMHGGTVLRAPMMVPPMMVPLGPMPMGGGGGGGGVGVAQGVAQGQPVPQMYTATVQPAFMAPATGYPAYPPANPAPTDNGRGGAASGSAGAPSSSSSAAGGAGAASTVAHTLGATGSSSGSGAAPEEPLIQLLDRLGLSAYLPDLNDLGAKTVADLSFVDDAMLDRTSMKPAERQRLLANRPPAQGGPPPGAN